MRFWSPPPRRVHHCLAALLLCPGAIALAESPATHPTIETVTDRKAVAAADLEKSLAGDWHVLHLDRDQKLTVWGVPISADTTSTAVIGCSSEYQFVMVTEGVLRQDESTATPGKVIFWSPTASPRTMEFSGRDFQRSMHNLGRDDIAAQLNDFTASQDRRRWWGLVKPMKVNIGQPVRASIDDARKSYLMQPEVLRVKRESPSTIDLPGNTARAMLADLKAGKTAEAAQLLSPELFLEPAKRNELTKAREAVASSLISQSWTKQINTDSVRATSDPLKYWFSAEKQNFVMTLKPFDQSVYVYTISPEETK